MMDYLCAMFGNFRFSRFSFIVRTESQTERITEADERYTHVTTVIRTLLTKVRTNLSLRPRSRI